MKEAIEALEDQYFLLRNTLGTPFMQNASAEEVQRLRSQIVQSRTNYWTAINSILQDDDPEVQTLVSQLKAGEVALAASIARLENVTKVLDAITKAVGLGAELLSKAVAL